MMTTSVNGHDGDWQQHQWGSNNDDEAAVLVATHYFYYFYYSDYSNYLYYLTYDK